MNPKEKAKELYDKMFKNCTIAIAGAGHIWQPLVKKQCLICVEEIINQLSAFDTDSANGIKAGIAIGYFTRVKSEINYL